MYCSKLVTNKKRALLIGINYERYGRLKLQCAVTDLLWMSKMITEVLNFPSGSENLRILSDTFVRFDNADNREANRKDILEGIAW